MAALTRAKMLAIHARVFVREAHANGHTGTKITWLSLQETAQAYHMWGITTRELKQAALDCEREAQWQGERHMIDLRDAPWNAPKTSENGYDLRADGRGKYRIEKTDDGTWVGEIIFKGGMWHAERRGRTFAYLDVKYSARTAVNAFKGVARRSAEEELDDVSEIVDRRAREAGATWLTTAQHCLLGGGENASDTYPERTPEWYECALSSFYSSMDEYGQHGDRVYVTNVEDNPGEEVF